jgi:sulfite reductase alpha subunit-like flavoprotein
MPPPLQLRVLFASQTGVAKDAAETLARDAAQRGLAVACDSLAGWDCARVARAGADDAASAAASDAAPDAAATPHPTALWLFVASTTGDGAMPTNGQRFWRSLLRRELPAGALAGVRFTVLGLGDSSYAKFNAAARKLSTRLAQLGAAPFYERGLADEQSPLGLAGDVDIWARGLWAALDAAFPPSPPLRAAGGGRPQLVRSQYDVQPWAAGRATGRPLHPSQHGAFSLWPAAPVEGNGYGRHANADDAAADAGAPPFAAIVTSVTRLTAPGWTQDVRHVELDIGRMPPSPRYQPGDVAWVFPKNTHGGLVTGAAGGRGGATPTAAGGDWLPLLAARLGVSPVDVVVVRVRCPAAPDCEHCAASCQLAADAAPLAWPYDARAHDARATLRPFSPPVHLTSGAWLSAAAAPPPAPHAPAGARLPGSGCPHAAAAAAPRVVVSVRELLECALDVHGTPRRSFFTQLSFFAADAEQAAKLAEMGAPAGADLYHTYCARERRSYAEVLCEFDSVALPLAYALELLPPLQPRAYSVASSCAATPGRLALCVAVAAYTTPWGRRKAGVASSWLAALQPGDVVPLAVTRGSFALPADPAVPLLLVGPGTGIAPMRSLVLERAACLRGSLSDGSRAGCEAGGAAGGGGGDASDPLAAPAAGGGVFLYFGCRRRDSDWLYGPQFVSLLAAAGGGGGAAPQLLASPPPAGADVPSEAPAAGDLRATASGDEAAVDEATAAAAPPAQPANAASFAPAPCAAAPLAAFHTAFSRDVPGRVLYVQGLLLRHKERVFAQLTGSPPAVVFIAGSAKRMPADVVDALRDVLCDVGGASVREADAFLAGMERAGRLVIEAWS